jgi:hypothetical protein
MRISVIKDAGLFSVKRFWVTTYVFPSAQKVLYPIHPKEALSKRSNASGHLAKAGHVASATRARWGAVLWSCFAIESLLFSLGLFGGSFLRGSLQAGGCFLSGGFRLASGGLLAAESGVPTFGQLGVRSEASNGHNHNPWWRARDALFGLHRSCRQLALLLLAAGCQ